jgi:hypothetical protein
MFTNEELERIASTAVESLMSRGADPKAVEETKAEGDARRLRYFINDFEPPPNKGFRDAWDARDETSRERVLTAWRQYRELGLPFVTYAEEEERHVFLEARVRCSWPRPSTAWFKPPECAQYLSAWDSLDKAEKSLLVFLAAADLLRKAGEWREERRIRRRIQGLAFDRAYPSEHSDPLGEYLKPSQKQT